MSHLEYFSVLFLLFLLPLFAATEPDFCPISPSAGNVTRLRTKLLCNYDKNTLPSSSTANGGAEVMLFLQINSLDMREHQENLILNGVLRFMWRDNRLTWEPANYGNLRMTVFDAWSIWTPDINLNLLTGAGVRELRTGDCIAINTGQIICSPNVNLVVPCTQDMRHFPFDQHNCSFTFSSMMHFEHQIDLKYGQTDLRNSRRNRGFEVLGHEAYLQRVNLSLYYGAETYYPIHVLSIAMKRRAGAAAASIILPAFGLMILTLSTFWMGKSMMTRLTTCGFASMGFIAYLVTIFYMIPSNGDTVPVIVTILRDGFLLCIFAGVIAVVVGNMAASTGSPPRWLTRITDWVELGFLGRLLLPSASAPLSAGDEEATILDGPSKIHPWTTVTQILDRLSFFVTLGVIAVLFMGYIP